MVFGILRNIKKKFRVNMRKKYFLRFPSYDAKIENVILSSGDPVRFSTLALAINTIKKDNIKGNFAEVGVYRGNTSRIIHLLDPEKTFYLFDTFEGFASEDFESVDDANDNRFRDTSMEILRQTIGDLKNIVIKKGYFPDTTKGLENETFSFIMIDVDKYKPTLAALQFFHPRLTSGGYIFVHDFNNPESNRGVSRAVNEFFGDKSEKLIEIPDKWGSIVIRKV